MRRLTTLSLIAVRLLPSGAEVARCERTDFPHVQGVQIGHRGPSAAKLFKGRHKGHGEDNAACARRPHGRRVTAPNRVAPNTRMDNSRPRLTPAAIHGGDHERGRQQSLSPLGPECFVRRDSASLGKRQLERLQFALAGGVPEMTMKKRNREELSKSSWISKSRVAETNRLVKRIRRKALKMIREEAKNPAPAPSGTHRQRKLRQWKPPEPDWSSAPWLRELFEEPPAARSKTTKRPRKPKKRSTPTRT